MRPLFLVLLDCGIVPWGKFFVEYVEPSFYSTAYDGEYDKFLLQSDRDGQYSRRKASF